MSVFMKVMKEEVNCMAGYRGPIDHLHASENILITFLIAVTSQLDAVDARKSVLYPVGIR